MKKFIRFHSASKSYFAKNKYAIRKSIQTCFLMGTGDVIAQTIVEKEDINQIDLKRTAKFAFVGLIFVGPSLATWYKILNAYVSCSRKFLTVSVNTKKLALNQLIFAPLFIPAYITAVNLINGKSWNYIQNDLKLKYLEILIMNYTVWPAFHIINFGIIPVKYQVLVNHTVVILWNAYLSFMIQTYQPGRRS